MPDDIGHQREGKSAGENADIENWHSGGLYGRDLNFLEIRSARQCQGRDDEKMEESVLHGLCQLARCVGYDHVERPGDR